MAVLGVATAAAAVAWLANRSAAAPPLPSTTTEEEEAGLSSTPVTGAPKVWAPVLYRKFVPPRAAGVPAK